MINASLNWASISGLFLILIWIPAIASESLGSGLLRRRADTSQSDPQNSFNYFINYRKSFLYPLAGGILFFQGWRLDPILQVGQSLLVIGIAVEMGPSFIDDFQKWKSRDSQLSKSISAKKQNPDK